MIQFRTRLQATDLGKSHVISCLLTPQAKWISEDQPAPAGLSLARLKQLLRYLRSRLVRGKILMSSEPLAILIRQITSVSGSLHVKLSLFRFWAQQPPCHRLRQPLRHLIWMPDRLQPPIAMRTDLDNPVQECIQHTEGLCSGGQRECGESFDPAQMKRFYFEQEERSFVDSGRTCSRWISWVFVLDRGLLPH